jgi:electron transfer flavoprotein-quinone oxidoreductase
MMLTPTQSTTIDFRTTAWGEPPYNGATALRSEFDSWLADRAVEAGATLITSTTVTGLRREGDTPTGAIVGVATDRPDGDIDADVVIACDGVNSFLAKDAGLHHHTGAEHYTLGVKEVLGFSRDEIERRFGVRDLDGVDYEVVGCTGDVPGGGFIYTNLDTVVIGLVLHVPGLADSGRRPEEILADFKAHPSVAPLVEGGDLVEYSAHLIPEGGYDAMPEIITDGMLVAGDAAGLCLAAGLWLEGVNFAIGSGAAAGEAAAAAILRGDTSAEGLAGYRSRLNNSFVLKDHKKLRRVPGIILGERLQRRYPQMMSNIVEEMFTVRNPAAKPGLRRIALTELKRSGIRLRDIARDLRDLARSFG